MSNILFSQLGLVIKIDEKKSQENDLHSLVHKQLVINKANRTKGKIRKITENCAAQGYFYCYNLLKMQWS